MRAFCQETSRTQSIRPDWVRVRLGHRPPNIAAVSTASVCPRLERMTLRVVSGFNLSSWCRTQEDHRWWILVVGQPGCERTLMWSHQGSGSPHRRQSLASQSGGEGGSERASLVGAESLLLSARPVQHDEREAHRHEHETQRCETSRLENAQREKGHFHLLLFVAC